MAKTPEGESDRVYECHSGDAVSQGAEVSYLMKHVYPAPPLLVDLGGQAVTQGKLNVAGSLLLGREEESVRLYLPPGTVCKYH